LGGIGKTRFLQEIENFNPEKSNIVLNQIIDYDSFMVFDIDVIKNKIMDTLGERHFKGYLDLEKEYTDKLKSSIVKDILQERFAKAFNQVLQDKKFILLIDTAEKIKDKQFWNDFRSLLSDLKSILVVISGRTDTLEGETVNRRELYFEGKIDDYTLISLKLRKFNQKESESYITKKCKVEYIRPVSKNILNCLAMLSNGKPILLDLVIEWISHSDYKDKPDDFVVNELEIDDCNVLANYDKDILYEKRDALEKRLVQRFSNVDSIDKKIIERLLYVSPLSLEMIPYLFPREKESISLEEFKEFSSYTFIKDLETGYVVLHDEMERLLRKYVLPNIDEDDTKKAYYSQQIIPFYETKLSLLNKSSSIKSFREIQERNAYAIALVKHLFIVDEYSEKAVEFLTREVHRARNRGDVTLMKSLLAEVSTHNMEFSSIVDFTTMKMKLLSMQKKNVEAKKLIETFQKEHENELTELTEANLRNMLAGVHSSMGELLEAEKNQRFAFEVFKKEQVLEFQQFSGVHLGTVYAKLGKFDNAITYFEEALEIPTEDNNTRAAIFNHMAMVHREQGDLEIALIFVEKALRLWEEEKSTKKIALGNITKGNVLRDNGEYEEAQICYTIAKSILTVEDDIETILELKINKAKSHWFRFNKEQEPQILLRAKELAEEALELTTKFGYNVEEIKALSLLINIYAELKEYDKAKAILDRFYQLSKEYSVSYYQVDAILAYVEFAYNQELDTLDDELEKRKKELKPFEENYHFPHFFGRMKLYEAKTLFNKGLYQDAITIYADALMQLSEHGGYSIFSLKNELRDFAEKLQSLNDKENVRQYLDELLKIWHDNRNENRTCSELIKWSKTQKTIL